jgi:hypothetical protein
MRTRADRRKPQLDPHTMLHVYKTEEEMNIKEGGSAESLIRESYDRFMDDMNKTINTTHTNRQPARVKKATTE